MKIKPDYAQALNNRGNVLQDLMRLEAALDSYDRALRIKPDYAEALHNRGNVLQDLRRLEEALESCDRAVRIRPDYADALHSRGDRCWLSGELARHWTVTSGRRRSIPSMSTR